MNGQNSQPLPSLRQLIRATILALIGAVVILLTIVLPAEYGVDPVGAGKLLGLTELNAAESDLAAGAGDVVKLSANAVEIQAVTVGTNVSPFRNEEQRLVLEPGRGIELKALMQKGEQVIFDWRADIGALYVDMHGEAPNAGKDEFTSYWIEKQQSSAQGTFTAPFEGSHGWYWRNRQDHPIAITVNVSGFFEKLYIPD